MAWEIDGLGYPFSSGVAVTAARMNALAADDRIFGGNVDGGGYLLSNVIINSSLFKPASGSLTLTFQDGAPTSSTLLVQSTTLVKLSNNALALEFDANTNGGVASQLCLATNGCVGIGVSPNAVAKLQVHTGTDQNLMVRPKVNLADGVALHSINDAIGVTKGIELIGSAVYLNASAFSFALAGIQVFANNAAAIAGGLTADRVYRTGANPDALCIVH